MRELNIQEIEEVNGGRSGTWGDLLKLLIDLAKVNPPIGTPGA